MPSTPALGLALMLEPAFAEASYDLFEAGLVDTLEWSFDSDAATLPDWAEQLMSHYSAHDRLTGHGISFSILSAEESMRQSNWLAALQQEAAKRSYLHFSEHFGFMSAGDFHRGAPLPVAHSPVLVTLGRERLRKMAEITGVPVGLENLAFAFCPDDVKEQGAFIDELLEPVNGFVLLDLHNLYCQSANFQISLDELLDCYPLQRVRELHISGGSWSEVTCESGHGPIRRDTHDHAVPRELFDYLPKALKRCPNVRTIIFERLGRTINNYTEAEQFRADFKALRAIVAAHANT